MYIIKYTFGCCCLLCAGDALSKVHSSPSKMKDMKFHIPSQGHMYMEPQTAVAEVEEGGCVRVHVSTQNLDAVMMQVAQALKLQHNQVRVHVTAMVGYHWIMN